MEEKEDNSAQILVIVFFIAILLFCIFVPSDDSYLNDINNFPDDAYIKITVKEYHDIFTRLDNLEKAINK